MSKKEKIFTIGHQSGQGLRETSDYIKTQQSIDQNGVTEVALNSTPPIGLNLRLLAEDPIIIGLLRSRLGGKGLQTALLGLAIPAGVGSVNNFIERDLQARQSGLDIFDIDQDIIEEVNKTGHPHVLAHLQDARTTHLPDNSQDLVIRDHVGNCCPPKVDEAIDREASRILKPGGISIVNISTSEMLPMSKGRGIFPFNGMRSFEKEINIQRKLQVLLKEIETFPNGGKLSFGDRLIQVEAQAELEGVQQPLEIPLIEILNTEIYNLGQLAGIVDNHQTLRSRLMEIGPDRSFVVFGEDEVGHGEWFRSLSSHKRMWDEHGMQVLHERSRNGWDSHIPPLSCIRRSVILEKK